MPRSLKTLLRAIVAFLLKLEVKLYLWRHQPSIIAVTGVTGKTAVKRAIAEELVARGVRGVRAHPKCYNTDIGLPLAILMVEPSSFSAGGWLKVLRDGFVAACKRDNNVREVLVAEYGVSTKGDMLTLLGIAHPHVAVITDIVDHPQSQATTAVMYEEMRLLARALEPQETLILNADFEAVKSIAVVARPSVNVVFYGRSEGSTYQARDVQTDNEGISFMVNSSSHHLARHGEHHLSAALASFAAADVYHALS